MISRIATEGKESDHIGKIFAVQSQCSIRFFIFETEMGIPVFQLPTKQLHCFTEFQVVSIVLCKLFLQVPSAVSFGTFQEALLRLLEIPCECAPHACDYNRCSSNRENA